MRSAFLRLSLCVVWAVWAQHEGKGQSATMPAINIEDLSEKEKLKMEVEQLRKEVKLDRQPVSKCSEEIKNYIEERSGDDPLVKGIPEDRNPFKEKGGCIIA
ncbi:guanine nucleotide-binding protein G(I)/G(S)/G(O) subunit gamma-11 isoform X2 [Anolis carolinensis]|uniref:guanine nucleotide-binding protein G(I)/G(S)/G(O) subunit gamma-11 isoform X2 n=1 Tax=Anolis carolinensis TaxID=28377 RepID=UPI000462645E|nr:PREDICTED: guanine nucleotide-binding protein G(I)/G(S)/G(O) subunit gamma-11 isoform X2 [Anolis carolinensis]|eukprot:XP_008110739.1 PREDICTED: guanine nucleotide-binding protein G(I)/G(S)/G(O) subunit gamma-11 isoform X2 [Anolis carolinensis]